MGASSCFVRDQVEELASMGRSYGDDEYWHPGLPVHGNTLVAPPSGSNG